MRATDEEMVARRPVIFKMKDRVKDLMRETGNATPKGTNDEMVEEKIVKESEESRRQKESAKKL